MPAKSSHGRWLQILAVLVAADVVSSFETMMVYSALKRFYVEFGDPATVGWVITAYLLIAGAASVACGRLGDLFGRKRMLLILLACAVVGSMISAMHQSLGWVIAGRAVQGMAGAILPLCYGLVREHVPENRIPLAGGLLMSAGSIGTIGGLILGGVIVDHLPWQAMFWTSGAMAALVFAAAALLLPRDPVSERPSASFDLAGGLAFVPAIVALLLAVTMLQAWGAYVLFLAGPGLAILAWWVRHELSVPRPLIDLRLLGKGHMARPNLCMIAASMGPLQLTLVMMLMIQQPAWTGIGLGLSAALAGGMKTPANIASILLSPLMGQACRICGSPAMIAGGFALNILAWVAALIWPDSFAVVMVVIVMSTIGTTASFIAIANTITLGAPAERAGEAMGVAVLGRAMANATGVQIMTFLLASVVLADPASPAVHLPAPQAYHLVFATIIAISVVGLILALSMRRDEPKRPFQRAMSANRAARRRG